PRRAAQRGAVSTRSRLWWVIRSRAGRRLLPLVKVCVSFSLVHSVPVVVLEAISALGFAHVLSFGGTPPPMAFRSPVRYFIFQNGWCVIGYVFDGFVYVFNIFHEEFLLGGVFFPVHELVIDELYYCAFPASIAESVEAASFCEA